MIPGLNNASVVERQARSNSAEVDQHDSNLTITLKRRGLIQNHK